jgi:hypothetical protein
MCNIYIKCSALLIKIQNDGSDQFLYVIRTVEIGYNIMKGTEYFMSF